VRHGRGPELLDLVELEVASCVVYGFPGTRPGLRGSRRAINATEVGRELEELYGALDTFIAEPVRENDKPFLMPSRTCSRSPGRDGGTAHRARGVKVQEEVQLVGFGRRRRHDRHRVEMFRKLLDQGQAGDNVGCSCAGSPRRRSERGMVLAKPNSIKRTQRFAAEVYVLTKERHTPFFKGTPAVLLRTTT
jgi:elongation factor Tu